jgi:hypothetical protein
MTPEARALLQQIGAALDGQKQLQVRVNGLVALQPSQKSTENFHERQGKRRSAAGPRQRAAGRKRPARGSRAASAASRIGGVCLRKYYEDQRGALLEAYPTLDAFEDGAGMWLLANSSILEGIEREARFLVAVPYQSGMAPRAWGYWVSGDKTWWIGPRHTNFQDGSICAFAPSDGVWGDGGNLTTLLDLYSVWALRHLHLEVFGRWPGKQYGLFNVDPIADAYYRSRECKDNELCACGSEIRHYANCCKQYDTDLNFIEAASHFVARIPGGFASRRVPPPVASFLEGRSGLPEISAVHLQMKA